MFKVGDIVRILRTSDPFYRAGDIATIRHLDPDGDAWADFNDHGNSEVMDGGTWCIGRNRDAPTLDFEVIVDAINP